VVAPEPPARPTPVKLAGPTGRRTVASRAQLDETVEELHTFLDEHAGENIVVEWRVEQ
jgi:hypothetical protein